MSSPIEPPLVLQKAKVRVVLEHPFFASLLLGLRQEYVKNPHPVPTNSTDGKSITFNVDHHAKLSEKQAISEIVHEIYHLVYMHPWRKGSRDSRLWNLAGDFVINDLMKKQGFEMDSTWALDPRFTSDMSADEVYAQLLKNPPPPNGGDGDPQQGKCGHVNCFKDAPSNSSEADMQMQLVKAAQAAKGRGKLPTQIEALLADLLEPEVDWRGLLDVVVRRCAAKEDYTWKRPSRRFAWQGLYLPSMHGYQTGFIGLAFDASGSVGMEQFKIFLSEFNGLLEQMKPARVKVVQFDTQIQHKAEYDQYSYPLTGEALKRHAYGGTDFRPIFTEFEDDHPDALIIMTDLEGPFPGSAPPYQVVWLNVGGSKSSKAPFGMTVWFKDGRE